jgi:hypothetical protein
MNNIKNFKQFNESNEFNWQNYGEKRELVMNVIPKLANRIRPLKEFGERIFHKIAHEQIGGSYMRNKQIKYGLNANMMSEIYNQIDSFKHYVGPKNKTAIFYC